VTDSFDALPGLVSELDELFRYLTESLDRVVPGRRREVEGYAQAVNAARTRLVSVFAELTRIEAGPLEYGVFLGVAPAGEGRPDPGAELALLRQVFRAAAGPDLPGDRIEPLLGELEGLLRARAEQRQLVVAAGGRRLEVDVGNVDVDAAALQEGQEVVLNKAFSVVGVRAGHARGETAEVINVISPAGTARVLGTDAEGGRVRLQWAGSEKKFDAFCDEALRATLRLDQLVAVDDDADEPRVVGRVRPRLHVRSGGSDGIIVDVGEKLFEEGVSIGDIVRIDPQVKFAFERLPSYETGGLALESVPDVSYEDIGGLEGQIEEIRGAIDDPYLHRELYERFRLTRPKGILLHGPPGCGKTMIAKAVANNLTRSIRQHLETAVADLRAWRARAAQRPSPELPASLRALDVRPENAEQRLAELQARLHSADGIRSFFFNVKGPELLNKYVGETEHRIRKVFDEARRKATFYTPVVIFFDEVESLFRARGSGLSSDVETTIVPQFLAEMDGVEGSEHVIVIGASNRYEMIDPALLRPGRLDIKISIERPDRAAARTILALYLTPDLPLDCWAAAANAVPAVGFERTAVEAALQAAAPGLSAAGREAFMDALPARSDVRAALRAGAPLDTTLAAHGAPPLAGELVRREWAAEGLIVRLTTLLYSAASRIDVVTSLGHRHSFALSQFVSGAVLASIVSRAKRAAVRRFIDDPTDPGIRDEDLVGAARDEFGSNAEQLAHVRLEDEFVRRRPNQPVESVRVAEVHLADAHADPWSVEKVMLIPLPRSTADAVVLA
jgi:SpoVK/Ycf46/Vps4 family AAA+-type ATPase